MADGEYSLGHSERELARLARQAGFYARFTHDVLAKAGLQPGMRVLDVGCGVGDVTMEAARLVGPDGAVVGVDRSEVAIATARERAAAAGLTSATFQRSDLLEPAAEGAFDAVIGRFILMHVPDPAQALAALAARLPSGGVVAFIEMDLSSTQVVPPSPLFSEALGWIMETYRRDGVEPDMGSRLYSLFDSVGLRASLDAVLRIEAGPDADAHEYLAETVRSLLPRMAALGVATPERVGPDTLAARAKQEAALRKQCFFYPRMVGAWARRS